jgi:hypothetical protein
MSLNGVRHFSVVATGNMVHQFVSYLRAVTLLLVLGFAVWAIYLLAVGLPVTVIPESPPGATTPPGAIVYQPYFGAVYSLAALLLVGAGLLRSKWLPLAWVGVALHLLSGGLLIFSMGILYIAVAGGLAVPLGMLQWQITQQRKWLATAWIGVGLVLLVGILLAGTSLATIILASGILLGAILAAMQWRTSE